MPGGDGFWQPLPGGTGGGGYPHTVGIVATTPAITHNAWNTINWASVMPLGFRLISSGGQNAAVAWDVLMDAGTWTIGLTHQAGTSRGIYSVRIDGTQVGLIDGYGASEYNATGSVTGVAVATAGIKRLSLVMATKNASSSDYFGTISHISAIRTGA